MLAALGALGVLGGQGLAASAPRAAPREVGTFDATTWSALQAASRQGGRPMVVVFSATWCAVCPGVIARLAADPRRARLGAALLVVVIDLAPGQADGRLLADAHYAAADRLLAFDGPAAALRHAVAPGWRGTMPAVAWLTSGQAPAFVEGEPPPATLARWWGER